MDSVLNPSSGGHSTRCGRPDPTNQPSINARSWVGGGRDAVEALGGGYRGSSMVSVDRHRRRRRNAKLDRSPRSSYIGRAATYAHARDTRPAGRCRGVAKLIFLLGNWRPAPSGQFFWGVNKRPKQHTRKRGGRFVCVLHALSSSAHQPCPRLDISYSLRN